MPAQPKKLQLWKNVEPPATFERECFPPLGIQRLLPHHFILFAQPIVLNRCCCCCCHRPAPAQGCSIDLQLEPDTFGPGRSIHVVVVGAPFQYFAEFYLTWTATNSGQVTVRLELVSGPVAAPRLLADRRGPSDRFLFSTNRPGTYLFRVTATDAQGKSCFDTLQVDVPAV